MQRHLYLFIIFIIFCETSLINCSLYQSTGRKTFESKAGGNVQTQVGASNIDNCWVQSSNDALPNLESSKKYTIDLLENDELLVCFE